MKRKMPIILLVIVCAALAVFLQLQQREKAQMAKKIADMEAGSHSGNQPTEAHQAAGQDQTAREDGPATIDETPEPEPDRSVDGTSRIMRDMAKTMEENPTINKMIEASQRGAIGALYADMIEYLGLNADETKYFMDLLMYRQMANVDAHIKMTSGTLTEEEKQALQEHVYEVNDAMRAEMEQFLNDSKDFEEFKYYEDTIGERMMLSQMDQMLGENALPEDSYREVLNIMYEEREKYNWSTDLNDNENRDLSAERYSQENIRKHIADVKAVGELMDQRMQAILTPEQLAAWRESGLAIQSLIEGQLLQANQMYGDD